MTTKEQPGPKTRGSKVDRATSRPWSQGEISSLPAGLLSLLLGAAAAGRRRTPALVLAFALARALGGILTTYGLT